MKSGKPFLFGLCIATTLLASITTDAHAYSYRVTAFANMEKMMWFDIPKGSAGNVDWHLHVYDELTRVSLGTHGKNWSQRAKLLVDKNVELPWSTPLLGMSLWEINSVFADKFFPVTKIRLEEEVAEQIVLLTTPESEKTYDKGRLHITLASRRVGESTYQLSESSMDRGLIRSESHADSSFLPNLTTAPLAPENSAVLYFFRIERL